MKELECKTMKNVDLFLYYIYELQPYVGVASQNGIYEQNGWAAVAVGVGKRVECF